MKLFGKDHQISHLRMQELKLPDIPAAPNQLLQLSTHHVEIPNLVRQQAKTNISQREEHNIHFYDIYSDRTFATDEQKFHKYRSIHNPSDQVAFKGQKIYSPLRLNFIEDDVRSTMRRREGTTLLLGEMYDCACVIVT
jgi:hypothetical protein